MAANTVSIESLKRRAREMKKTAGGSHSQNLEALARVYGYRTWASLLAASINGVFTPKAEDAS